jgi:exodeoxyribonuclease III
LFRVITANVNGIRAAARKGFFDWLSTQSPDVVCIQETKAQHHQLGDPCYAPDGYHCYYEDAIRKGYSGVAIYSRHEPDTIVRGFGVPEFDDEGRYLEIRLGSLSIVSVYLPSGSAGELRQASKFRFLDAFVPHLNGLRTSGREYILCGDWNIAHKEIDLKNWRSNRKNSGFLPEERQWLDELFGTHEFVDAFRTINNEADQYTWWSNRGRAWDKNVGWRLDYQIVTPGLRDKILFADIYKAQRFSDHAPLIMDYDLDVSGTGPSFRDFPGRSERAVDQAFPDHEPEQQDARQRQQRGEQVEVHVAHGVNETAGGRAGQHAAEDTRRR